MLNIMDVSAHTHVCSKAKKSWSFQSYMLPAYEEEHKVY